MTGAVRRDWRGVRAEVPSCRPAFDPVLDEPIAVERGSAPTVNANELWLGPGMVVADYAVVSRISDGPAVQTFEAVRRGTGRNVSLHVLGTAWSRLPGLSDAWIAWGNTIRRIQHPGLAECGGAGVTSDGLLYAAFEWLDGETLRARLDADSLTPQVVIGILVALLEALDAVHSEGLVHGDIRPENVFCTTDGEVKLLGLGLAQCLRSQQPASDGRLLVSAAYVSPEQIAGGPATVQTDLYAFGMLAHECLLGHHPLVSEPGWPSATEMLLRQAQRACEPLVSMPAPVRQVLESTVAKLPSARPASARHVLTALHRLRPRYIGVSSDAAGIGKQVGGEPLAALAPEWRRAGAVLALPGRVGHGPDAMEARPQGFEKLRPWSAVTHRASPQLLGDLGARQGALHSQAGTWFQWPYGHMLVGGVLGILAGVSVYLWQTRPNANVETPSGERQFDPARRGGWR